MKYGMLLVLGILFFTLSEAAAETISSRVSIHAGVNGVQAGRSIPVALLIELPDQWYTYAKDPGDAGMPPDIRFRAPEGVTIGAWRFPPHEAFTDDAGTSFGYKGRVVLLNEIRIPDEIPDAAYFQGAFDVLWMICKDVCLPFRDRVTLRLPQLPAGAKRVESSAWQDLLRSGGWGEEKAAE